MVIIRRKRALPSDGLAWARKYKEREQRRRIYKMRAFPIADNNKPTDSIAKISAHVFQEIAKAPCFKQRKMAAKEAYWQRVHQALLQAHWHCGCVKLSRNGADPGYSLKTQVIEAAQATGFIHQTRSPKGSPKMSRLIPTPKLLGTDPIDPWSFTGSPSEQYVVLLPKSDNLSEELSLDSMTPGLARPGPCGQITVSNGTASTWRGIEYELGHPTAVRFQTHLARVNEVNAQFTITCSMLDEWQGILSGQRQLRPVHIAVFRGSFKKGGRIYTGSHGHQGLRRIERQSIRFDGEESIELDFQGFHCRMLYHLLGLPFSDDPYCVFPVMTMPKRIMVKTLINCLINAKNTKAALAACNQKTNPRNESGTLKEGKARRDARELWEAKRAAKVGEFKDILPVVLEKHHRIAHYFGHDMGNKLMRLDGYLALAILHHFAKRSIPVLGVHDSFIVPAHCQAELRETMRRCYEEEVDFPPVIK
jgi:hypothetical protein